MLELYVKAIPIFAMVGAGLAIGWALRIREESVGRLTLVLIYVFVPILIFVSTARSDISTTAMAVVISVLVVVGVASSASYVLGRYLHLPAQKESSFILASTFMNAGSLGSSLALVFFGEEGFLLAIVFYITVQMSLYTVGVAVAARRREDSGLARLKPVFTLPLVYSMAAGLVVSLAGVQPPALVMVPLDGLSRLTIPLLLLTLGLQLSLLRPHWSHIRLPAMSAGLRIGVGVVAAFALVHALGLTGAGRGVVMISSMMPSAVTTFVVGSRFKCDTSLLALAILLSTVASLLLVPAALWVLGAT